MATDDIGVKQEPHTAESVDPTGFWRFLFWLAYVFGTLSLFFSWLYAQVPHGRHADLTLDFVFRASAAGLMLVSILMGKWIWRITKPLSGQDGFTPIRVVFLFAWIELAIAIYWVIGVAIVRWI